MKVCIVNSYYYPDIIGGAEISIQTLAENLIKKGIKVTIICLGKIEEKEKINGVDVYRIIPNNLYNPLGSKNNSKIKKMGYRILDIYNALNYKKLRQRLKEINPDIVHVNNIFGISPVIWRVCKDNNIKCIHTIRDCYLMCPKINLINSRKQLCINKSILCKTYSKLNQNLSREVDYVTAPSKFILDLFYKNKFFKNVEGEYIYNSIDVSNNTQLYLNEKQERISDKINIIFLGALDTHKGLEVLLEAFSKTENDNLNLHIAGKGRLEFLVRENMKKDSRIKYHGFVEKEDKENLLRLGDILIIPSICYEAFGRVVIDAYKYSMPVIGTKIGGITEIIQNEKTGLLIEPNNVEDIKNSLIYFSDRGNIKKMQINCIETLEKFLVDKQIDSFIRVYKKVLNT